MTSRKRTKRDFDSLEEDPRTATMFSLEGMVAVVTGGTGTLGTEFCVGLAKAGARVGVLGRKAEAGQKVVEIIKQFGGEAMFLQADVLKRESLEKARDMVLSKWRKIDILVNGAGGNQAKANVGPDERFFDMSTEACEKVFKLNIIGTILPTQIFGEEIAKNKLGSIVNISSLSAKEPLTRVCGYSAAKSGVENFTKWLATEMGHKYGCGIRCNAIAPGFFLAEQNRRLLTKPDGSLTDRGNLIIQNTPAGRFGEPHELIGALVFLCSPASRFVTGTVLRVDGGFGAFCGV